MCSSLETRWEKRMNSAENVHLNEQNTFLSVAEFVSPSRETFWGRDCFYFKEDWQESDGGWERVWVPVLILILILNALLSLQTLAHMKVIAFQGNPAAINQAAPPMTLQPITNLDLTPSPDVPLAILKRKMMASNDITVVRGLLMEINTHLKVKSGRISSLICVQ